MLFYFLRGVEVSINVGIIVVKAAIIMITCDLPARAIVLNMGQFNGSYMYGLCEDEGNHLPLIHYFVVGPTKVARRCGPRGVSSKILCSSKN